MSGARRRGGKAANRQGEFDLGFRSRTPEQAIAGGDLDAAYRIATNLTGGLRDVCEWLGEIQDDAVEFYAARDGADLDDGKTPAVPPEFGWRLVGHCCRWRMNDPGQWIRPVADALAEARIRLGPVAARSPLGPVAQDGLVPLLGHRETSMTLAVHRVMADVVVFTLDEDQGMAGLGRVWMKKAAQLTPDQAADREREFLADQEVADALSAARLENFFHDLYDLLRELLDDMDQAEKELKREFIEAHTFRIANRPPTEGGAKDERPVPAMVVESLWSKYFPNYVAFRRAVVHSGQVHYEQRGRRFYVRASDVVRMVGALTPLPDALPKPKRKRKRKKPVPSNQAIDGSLRPEHQRRKDEIDKRRHGGG